MDSPAKIRRAALQEALAACERPVHTSSRRFMGMPVTRARLPTREECIARIKELLQSVEAPLMASPDRRP